MNFSQLQSEVRRRLNEPSAVFWTDADIQNALNEGLAELADRTEYYERWANILMQTDRSYYDLRSLLPYEVLTPTRIYNAVTSAWLRAADTRNLDGRYATWETVGGEPGEFFIRGAWWLGVFPRPSVDGTALRLYYTAQPPALVVDEDLPEDLPVEFHAALVDYALADCYAQERETKKAEAWMKSFEGYAARLRMVVESRSSVVRKAVLQ